MQNDVRTLHRASCELRENTILPRQNARPEGLRQPRNHDRKAILMAKANAQILTHSLALRIIRAHLRKIQKAEPVLRRRNVPAALIRKRSVHFHAGQINKTLRACGFCKLQNVSCPLDGRHDRLNRLLNHHFRSGDRRTVNDKVKLSTLIPHLLCKIRCRDVRRKKAYILSCPEGISVNRIRLGGISDHAVYLHPASMPPVHAGECTDQPGADKPRRPGHKNPLSSQRLLKKRIICHAVKILLKDRIRRSLQLLFSCFFHVPVFSVFCMHIPFL